MTPEVFYDKFLVVLAIVYIPIIVLLLWRRKRTGSVTTDRVDNIMVAMSDFIEQLDDPIKEAVAAGRLTISIEWQEFSTNEHIVVKPKIVFNATQPSSRLVPNTYPVYDNGERVQSC